VQDMVANDQQSEIGAIRAYNAAIRLAHEVDDQGTVDLLTKILKMEEDHEDWNEQQRDQIEQMGLQNYLTNQTSGAA
jgi:bacterioferritin